MCGIAGILYRDPARPVERGTLKAMADAIAHRGPDAEGFWNATGVGLAHRRLSIIDLAGGDQPIGNEDGSVQVVFNGEIYNYRELRDGLAGRGHQFRTASDTEVLVHLYEELGPALVERLRGMFAFALWDARERRLVLARDRVGIKPLYVYRDGEKLLFGSELKAILAYPGIPREVDAEALEDYLAFGCVVGGRSIFRRIEKLPAAHVLAVSAERWEATPKRYWELRFEADERLSEGEWQEAIRAKVAESVARHLIADVPVGAFLSGGLDSSVVVAEAAREGSGFRVQGSGQEKAEAPKVRDSIAQGETLGMEADLNGKPQRGATPVEKRDGLGRPSSDDDGTARSPFPTELHHREADASRSPPSSSSPSTVYRLPSTCLQTFSMGFHESGFSELPYARQVAERFGTQHTEEIVTADAVKLVEELAFYFDEPFADSSAVPTFLVSQLARRHVKVVLSGDGGDEAFGGYARYAHDLNEAAWRSRLPGWLRRTALAPLGAAWPKADWLPRMLRAKTRLTNLALEADAAYANTLTLCRLPGRRRLLAGDVRAELNGHRPEMIVEEAFRRACFDATRPHPSPPPEGEGTCGTPEAFPTTSHYPLGTNHFDPLSGMLAADTAVLLTDDFLTKVDRASMAHGLEVRPPLVDHELLELAARMPSRFKVRGGETKWIVKRAYEDRLPRDAVWRAKHGFEIPVDRWFGAGAGKGVRSLLCAAPSGPFRQKAPDTFSSTGALCEMFEASVLSPNARVAALIDQGEVARLYRSHLAGFGRHGAALWAMLTLAKWAERWM